jgi:hypothetical protein
MAGTDTGEVAARPIEARDQTGLDRVVASAEDDRNLRGRGFGRAYRQRAAGRRNHADSAADQIRCQFRQSIVIIVRPAVLDHYIAALDVAGFAQAFAEQEKWNGAACELGRVSSIDNENVERGQSPPRSLAVADTPAHGSVYTGDICETPARIRR